ncbi:hypothetical protein KSB_85960 [Ktedonobacter robiniae]|uniref:AMP-dependent synthetase/ligase domain-containing protein n=1 Tax=Ktedonobacter robiniae TaxID=2778365 RepID=A0ABQ3V599_9CHLR|nr:hypothetical protein KSB_85960 [Ktedonobacter robiniae]
MLLEASDIEVVLTRQSLLSSLPPTQARILCLDQPETDVRSMPQENPVTAITSQNLAYIMYTSGSTGVPKGVAVAHQNIVRLVKETSYIQFADEIFLQFAPVSFDASTLEIWGSLLNGARLVIFPAHLPSLLELSTVLQRYQVSTLWLTAGLFHQMVDEQITGLRSVRQLLAGGDVLSVPHVQRVLAELPECALINGYGPTEGTTFTCCHPIQYQDIASESIPIGRPISNTQVYLLDQWHQPVPAGIAGELYIGGDGLARGYLHQAALTAERFVPHPWSEQPGARLYKTGDLARFKEDGTIEFLGRKDTQIKIRGFRVELGEIESVLAEFPLIQQCAVMIRTDLQGDKRLVAYIVWKSGASALSRMYVTLYRPVYPIIWFPRSL